MLAKTSDGIIYLQLCRRRAAHNHGVIIPPTSAFGMVLTWSCFLSKFKIYGVEELRVCIVRDRSAKVADMILDNPHVACVNVFACRRSGRHIQ